VEEGPEDSSAGTWAPASITCDGTDTDPTSSDTIVTLTPADPDVTCAFTNAFTANAPVTTTTAASGSGGGRPRRPRLWRRAWPRPARMSACRWGSRWRWRSSVWRSSAWSGSGARGRPRWSTRTTISRPDPMSGGATAPVPGHDRPHPAGGGGPPRAVRRVPTVGDGDRPVACSARPARAARALARRPRGVTRPAPSRVLSTPCAGSSSTRSPSTGCHPAGRPRLRTSRPRRHRHRTRAGRSGSCASRRSPSTR